jgi:hypothetical protein
MPRDDIPVDTNLVKAPGGIDHTQTIVDAQFGRAKDFAKEAWDSAIDLIDHLKTIRDIALEFDGIDYEDVNVDVQTRSAIPPVEPQFEIRVPTRPEIDKAQWHEDNSYVELDGHITDRLTRDALRGGTGLSPEVEEGIWTRTQNRLSQKMDAEYRKAEHYFAARGHAIPPGALAEQLLEVSRAHVQESADAATELAKTQAELAQQNTHFTIEAGQKHIALKQEYQFRKSSFDLERMKSLLQIYISELEAAYKEAALYVDIYKSSVQAYAALVEGIKVDVEAQVAVVKARIDKVKVYADISIKEAELIVQMALSGHGLQADAMKTAAQVTAQMAASAMSSVHASAQIGKSISDAYSKSYSLNKAESAADDRNENHTWTHSG